MEYERVQIMLRPEEREAVRRRARRLGVSMSEVVREALEPVVRDEQPCDEEDPFLALIGMIKDDGPTDMSVNVKHYLYGWPKKEPSGRTA
jgi:hypothetical protein